jgi:hypothetical protein
VPRGHGKEVREPLDNSQRHPGFASRLPCADLARAAQVAGRAPGAWKGAERPAAGQGFPSPRVTRSKGPRPTMPMLGADLSTGVIVARHGAVGRSRLRTSVGPLDVGRGRLMLSRRSGLRGCGCGLSGAGLAAGRAAVMLSPRIRLSGGARIVWKVPGDPHRRTPPGVSAAFKNAAGGPSRAGGALARQDVADVGATGDQGARAQRAPCSGCRRT